MRNSSVANATSVTPSGRVIAGGEVGWHGRRRLLSGGHWVRRRGGAELELPSWTAIQKADLLTRWAFNQMLIGVAT